MMKMSLAVMKKQPASKQSVMACEKPNNRNNHVMAAEIMSITALSRKQWRKGRCFGGGIIGLLVLV